MLDPLGGYAWVGCAFGGSGGSLECASRGRAGLGAGGQPVQDQGSAKLEAGGFIIPCGPALLYVL